LPFVLDSFTLRDTWMYHIVIVRVWEIWSASHPRQ